jgi:hypothetical protein
MLRFKDYLKESTEHYVNIDVDTKTLEVNLDTLNDELDKVTLKNFVNSSVFVNAVRGTLERFGVILPAHSNIQQLSVEGEWVYKLGDSGYYAYIVHELSPEGEVEGYAQIVDTDELDSLKKLDFDDFERQVDIRNRDPIDPYPPARRDDDSGDNIEYA